jgi:flagellar motor switch protein FliM
VESDGASDERARAAVRQGVERVDITLRAEVADTTMTLEDVLALRPGDVVRLDADAGDEVTICADRTPVHRARAGRHDRRRAVQVLGPAGGAS